MLNLNEKRLSMILFDDLHIVDALEEVGDLTLGSLRITSTTICILSCGPEGAHLAAAQRAILVGEDKRLEPDEDI